jgi:hypothetical protein
MTTERMLRYFQLLPPNLQNEALEFIVNLLKKHNLHQPQPLLEKKRPKFGSAKGKYQMAPDFDAPLDDFKAYTGN